MIHFVHDITNYINNTDLQKWACVAGFNSDSKNSIRWLMKISEYLA